MLDHQHRRDTARRHLHDDTLKPEDRLAGLLVLPVAPLAAVFQLATADPAAILARTLGIHTDVAVSVTWQRHSAGDWTASNRPTGHLR